MPSAMEIFVLIVSFLVFIFAVAKLLSSSNHSPQAQNQPNEIPGPKKLPVIGNLHLLAGRSLPHRAFRDLSVKYGPLMRLQLGQIPFLVVSSVEVAKEVLRSHDVVFANRIPLLAAEVIMYNYKDIALAPYGEHWRQLRKICTLELLSSKRVRSFRAVREEENMNLAKWIASKAGSAVNVSERLYLSSFDIIMSSLFGDKTQYQAPQLTRVIQQGIELGSGFCIADLFPSYPLLPFITGLNYKIAKIFRVTDAILQSIIVRHRSAAADDDMEREKDQSEDLVDVLLKCQQDDALRFQLTTDTIKAVILDLLFGGTGTSATVVEWAMSELIRNPTTLRRAQEEVREVLDGKGYVDEGKFDEMKYFKLVIKETMRLHPPLPFLLPRMSSERCKIKGYEIAAGSRVIINAWALGRDPRFWDEAEKFKPERFEESSFDFKGNSFEYIPFGSGRRICPGISMGVANLEYTLAMLLYHFDWEMPNGMKNEDLDMTESFGASVVRKNDLFIIPTLNRPIPELL